MSVPLPSSAPAIPDLARELFNELRSGSFDGVGVTRASYGESESRALSLLAKKARREQLLAASDRAGNLVISLEGEDAGQPAITCGSHVDSVPEGGNYDGAAGVVAGLLALVHLRRLGIAPPRSLKVLALRGEESAWFGQA
tara:strand:+ start:4561 stop:4983 length:423 start_codon:yes stop_codon:yes gene_type:complete